MCVAKRTATMRILSLALLAAVPLVTTACVSEDEGEDLGSVIDGKGDGALIDADITVPKKSSSGAISPVPKSKPSRLRARPNDCARIPPLTR